MRYLQYVKTDDNGRCWWDTGIVPDINTKVELSIRPTVQSSESSSYCCQGYLGSQRGDDTTDSFQVRLFGWSWTGLWFRVGTTQVDYQPHSELFDTWINITLDKDNYTVNGDSYSVGASYMDENVRSLYIGGINNPNWNHKRSAFGTMFGEVKIWQSGVLVFDGIPAEDNGALGFYDEVSQTFKSNLGTGTPVAGPDASSIFATPSKRTLASTGETISIEVATENAWTLSTSGGSFLTFSSTGDTSGATITATAPGYSGSTPREEYLTFVDSVTSDESVITIKQKKYQSGQPFYLGGDEVTDCYVGGDAVVEAYLGEDLVYSSGPFQGITIIPKTISFNSGLLLRTCKIKASESWTMTVPAWLTASTLTGNTGETVVSLSTTAMTAATSGTIEVVSTNYTASTLVKYSVAEFVNGIKASQMSPNGNRMLDTGIQPNTTTSGNVTGNLYYHNDGVMIGIENAPDNNDFRLFHPSGNLMMDFGNQRCYNGFTASDGTATQVDIDFGNCYFTEKIRGVSKASPTSFTGTLPSGTIKIDLACMSVSEIKFWTDGNLVFDGKAAKIGTDYGLYDVVSDTLITTNDFTIVEEQ